METRDPSLWGKREEGYKKRGVFFLPILDSKEDPNIVYLELRKSRGKKVSFSIFIKVENLEEIA